MYKFSNRKQPRLFIANAWVFGKFPNFNFHLFLLMNNNAEKLKALQLTIDKLEKTYGKGTVMKLSDNKVLEVPAISTGSLGLDMALGVGGIPRGRVIEIYGPESSGKTTLTMHCIAEAQKAGGLAAFIDAEHAFDKSYAEKLGIDTENLLISQPDNGEQALEIAEHLIRSGAIDILVIDSVGAQRRTRRRNGRQQDGLAGPIDVSSLEKTDRGN